VKIESNVTIKVSETISVSFAILVDVEETEYEHESDTQPEVQAGYHVTDVSIKPYSTTAEELRRVSNYFLESDFILDDDSGVNIEYKHGVLSIDSWDSDSVINHLHESGHLNTFEK